MAQSHGEERMSALDATARTMLVTGATGFIGQHVCRRALAAGQRLIVLTRSEPRARALFGDQVRIVASLAQLPSTEHIDVVVNLAGAPIAARPWTRQRRELLLSSRLDTTHVVTELIARLEHKPDVLVSASAIGYYGVRGDEPVTEADRGQPIFQSHLCQAWELAAQSAKRHGVRVCQLRIAVVLGRDGGTLSPLSRVARKRLRVVLGSGRQGFSWIHLEDLLALIDFCIEQPDIEGGVNAAAPEPVTQREFATALSAVYGASVTVPLPAWSLWLAMGELAQLLVEGQRVVPARARSHGFEFKYPQLPLALADLLGKRPASS